MYANGNPIAHSDDDDDLKDNELFNDRMGQEMFAVGRGLYAGLVPCKLGDMIVIQAPKAGHEKFWVAKLMTWDKYSGTGTMNYYNHPKNAKKPDDAKRFYLATVHDDGEVIHLPYTKPVGIYRRKMDDVERASIFYWADDLLVGGGKMRAYHRVRMVTRIPHLTPLSEQAPR
jgi:hypothetical protein